jgi:hypothetical protein
MRERQADEGVEFGDGNLIVGEMLLKHRFQLELIPLGEN